MNDNFFSQEDENEAFRDIPDEVIEGQSAPIPNIRVNRPTQQVMPPMQQPKIEEEVEESEPEDEDFSSVLTDARFRLEQGRLYEMIMNHDIFQGADADEKAIKYVTKQVRNFAKEQMEIMLGMRQETVKSTSLTAEDFPFNDLEIQTLKQVAATITKGATASPEAQQFSGVQVEPRKTGLNTIGVKSTPKPKQTPKPVQKALSQKPATPVKRRNEQEIENILAEEGISREEYDRQYNPDYKPLTKPLSQMSENEIKEWKRQDALKTNKQVKNPQAIPMPTPEQEEMLHTSRAQTAASHPQMQLLMNALTKPKTK